ncbi:MAG: allantoicase [Planctomycetota bacterium]
MSTHTGLVDLASARLGGRAIMANNEFYAPVGNLLKPGIAELIQGKFTEQGKLMDGWATRRRREPGHDWCIIKLGAPGVVRGVNVDTRHFRGDHPEACSVEACNAETPLTAKELADREELWFEIVRQSPLQGDSENHFQVVDTSRYTHIRLNIYPDGAVARFRVHGEVIPDWQELTSSGEAVDLVAAQNGGRALGCSDEFFSEPLNLIMPGLAENAGDGWETRRRREPGFDWVILQLGRRGIIERIEVDTLHFKGNYPKSCSLDGCDSPDSSIETLTAGALVWTEILRQSKLQGHSQHFFEKEIVSKAPVTHVRLNIYPDGGVSRLRLHGKTAE